MTGLPIEKIKAYVPSLNSRWWTGLLGVSLMVNLLVGGAIIGRAFHDRHGENMGRASFVQLVPRKFIIELPSDRRRELMQFMRDDHQEMKSMRAGFQATALKLADVLDVENFDAANVKAIIDNFTTGSESLAARGGAAVEDLISKLTPMERKQLAAAIRDKENRDKN
jgi:uncharacterized membrane protein